MKFIKISNKKPPQWILDKVKEKWGVEWESNTVFTYGDLITTYHGKMTEDLRSHEGLHVTQQKEFPGGPEAWWKKYLDDDEFRFDQELAAYRKQYNWLKSNKSRGEVYMYLNHYAKCLSGEMYGSMVDEKKAMRLITGDVL
jgi:hypothetical protein